MNIDENLFKNDRSLQTKIPVKPLTGIQFIDFSQITGFGY